MGIHPPGHQQTEADGDKVEDSRRQSGQAEVMEAVQQAHVDRRQGKKEDEGKKNAGEFDGQLRFAGDRGKTRVEKMDKEVGLQDAHANDGGEHDEKEGVDVVGEAVGGGFSLLGEFLGEGGDEGGGEGAFGKKVPQKIGDAEGGDQGVELLAGAEDGVEENLADQPKDAGGPDRQHHAGGAFGAHRDFSRVRAALGGMALMGERT